MRIDLFVKSFLLLFVLCISNDAYAGSFEDGVAAYTKGDFSTAMRLFRPLAESGNANAQYKLGLIYDLGKGTPKDDKLALRWYQAAALKGFALACFHLGQFYEKGRGVNQSYAEAYKFYSCAESKTKVNADRAAAEEKKGIVAKKLSAAELSRLR